MNDIMIKKMYSLIYRLTAMWLPISGKSKIAKCLRAWFGKKIMLFVGKNVNIERGALFNTQCSLDDYSGIGINCELHGPVLIGKYVNMGPEVVIYTINHKTEKTDIIMQKQGYTEPRPVTIEDDVWIGRRVIILPGVIIGKGSVIGAGAVVSKSIPPYSVAVGNPAVIIKSRLQNN